MDRIEPILIPRALTLSDQQLLLAFKLHRGHIPRVHMPTGEEAQDRIIFELARRAELIGHVQQAIGPDVVLWGASISPAITGLPLVAQQLDGPTAVTFVCAISGRGSETTLQIGDGPRGRLSLPSGLGLLLDARIEGFIASASDPSTRILILRFATPTAILKRNSRGDDLFPVIELVGSTKGTPSPIILSPRRGPYNAFAIPLSHHGIPDEPPIEPQLLAAGHTDIHLSLRIWSVSGQMPERHPLSECLQTPISSEDEGGVRFWPVASSESDTPHIDKHSIVIEWIGVPQGKADAGLRAPIEGTSLPPATTYLSRLALSTHTLQGDAKLHMDLAPHDTFLLLRKGRMMIGDNYVVAPTISAVPAGVSLDLAALTGEGAEIVKIETQGIMQEIAAKPVAKASAHADERLVFFCIPLAPKRYVQDWSVVCKHVDATLRTIYAQTDPNWRVIVVGSEAPDLTLDLDDRFSFLAVTRDVADGSKARARADSGYKRGLAETRAREQGAAYVCFVDSDDLVSKDLVAFIRRHNHPFGYVFGRGLIYDAQRKLIAPLPLQRDVYSLDEQTASCAAFNTSAVPHVIHSAINRDGHVRYRESMYLAGMPLMDVPFPTVTYARFTNENMTDLFPEQESHERALFDRQMREAIQEQSLPLSKEIIDGFGLKTLVEVEERETTFKPKRISVAVCTHNRPQGLESLLQTLVPQIVGRQEREIVVVNDGTHNDKYAAVVARFAPHVRYHALPSPGGIARARNRSAELSLGEILVFTDDDCEAPAHWLDWLDATLTSHPEVDVIAGKCGPLRLEDAGFVGKVQAHYELLPSPHGLGGTDQGFVTACLAVRSDWFRRVGGFAERTLFAMAGEDTDLSLRLVRAGARTKIDPDWQTYHILSRSLRSEMRRYWRYGFSNAQVARSPESPQAYRHLRHKRMGDVLSQFTTHFKRSRGFAQTFSENPVERLASRLSFAAIQTAYDAGAAAGAKAPLR